MPYPPPPAKVEEICPTAGSACVWADGYWDFTDRWEWQAGEWVMSPGCICRLAPVELRRRQGGRSGTRARAGTPTTSSAGPQSAAPSARVSRPPRVQARAADARAGPGNKLAVLRCARKT